MTRIPVITLALLLSLHAAFAGNGKKTENEYVKVSVSLKERSLKPGETGEMLIAMRPKSGIHVNLQPPIDIKLDSNSAFALVGGLHTSKGSKPEYLDASKPIRQTIKLKKTMKLGTTTVSGTLIYFYCSDADGWCSRFKQPFTLTMSVSK